MQYWKSMVDHESWKSMHPTLILSKELKKKGKITVTSKKFQTYWVCKIWFNNIVHWILIPFLVLHTSDTMFNLSELSEENLPLLKYDISSVIQIYICFQYIMISLTCGGNHLMPKLIYYWTEHVNRYVMIHGVQINVQNQ